MCPLGELAREGAPRKVRAGDCEREGISLIAAVHCRTSTSDRMNKTGANTSGTANRRDISHSCRSAASVACCSGSIVPVVLSAPKTGLRQPHEQTAWTPPSPSCWIVMEWCTAIGVLPVNDRAHRRRQRRGHDGRRAGFGLDQNVRGDHVTPPDFLRLFNRHSPGRSPPPPRLPA